MILSQSQQIIGKRETQQDALACFRVSNTQQLFVLADGMGGHQGGETASKIVIETFLHDFADFTDDELSANALYTTLEHANRAIEEKAFEQPMLQGMGTTLIAVLIDEQGQFDYISVGDSPLYQTDAGSLKRINANHAFAEQLQQMVADGLLSAAEAAQHPQRHAITSAVAGGQMAQIDQGSGSLQVGERLVLASDGVQTLSHEQLTAIITQPDFASIAHQVMQHIHAIQAVHQDNASLIVLQSDTMHATRAIQAPPTLIPLQISQPIKLGVPIKSVILGLILALVLVLLLGYGWLNAA